MKATPVDLIAIKFAITCPLMLRNIQFEVVTEYRSMINVYAAKSENVCYLCYLSERTIEIEKACHVITRAR